MTSILQSLSKTVHISFGLAVLLFLGLYFFGDGFAFDTLFGVGYLDLFMLL